MDERAARAALTALTEPGDPGLWRCVRDRGAARTLDAIRSGQYPYRNAGTLADRLPRVDVDQLWEAAGACGARLLCPGDREWPEEAADRLAQAAPEQPASSRERDGPPLALWARGPADLAELTRRACSIVGSRAATGYGIGVAGEVAADLAERGFTVVSGGAFGVDAAAHRGALAVSGHTIAVLASGVDLAYPREHEMLLSRIATEGLVISEVPPGWTPTRPRFLVRNRLIAAMTAGTVVVEAALRSGALNTASWAHNCGREVMGIPGPVTSDMSAGVHQLLRQSVPLVTNAAEIAEVIGAFGEDLAPDPPGETRSRDELGPRARTVVEVLQTRKPLGVARVAQQAGLGLDETRAVLGRLMVDGYAELHGAGWRLSEEERRRIRGHQ